MADPAWAAAPLVQPPQGQSPQGQQPAWMAAPIVGKAPQQKAQPQPPQGKQQPDIWGPTERVGLGFVTPMVGLAQGGAHLGKALGLTSPQAVKEWDEAASALDAAKTRLRARGKVGAFDKEDVIGQALNPINYAVRGASILRQGAQGAATGFMQPTGSEHPTLERAENTVAGLGAGLGFGAAGKLVGAGAKALGGSTTYQRLVDSLPKWGQSVVDAVIPRTTPQAAAHAEAVARVLKRFGDDEKGGGPSATQAIAAVNTARGRGTPMALADAGGKNIQGLAGSLARQPGAPKAIAEQQAASMMREAGKRLSGIISEGISSGPTMRQGVEALTAGQKAAAAPLYEKAFDTSSTAPLLPTLKKHLDEATTRSTAAAKAAAEARTALAGQNATVLKKATPARVGPSLLEWVSKRGGVIDEGGDLKAMGADRWHVGKPGKGKLLTDAPEAGAALPGFAGKAGGRDDKGLDDVARAAWEAGYLPGERRPDTNTLLDAMRRELHGEKVHTQEDAELLHSRSEAERYADFVEGHKETARAAAESAGSRLTKSEEHHAAEMIAQGAHPQEAIEDAETASRHGRNIADETRSRKAYQSAKLAKAETDMRKAQQDRMQAQTAIRQGLADQSIGKKGGVWSPRIQAIISDPIMKPAIARGIEVQRLEALATGRPFNPRDFAITGEDKDGQWIIDKVPNMRLLHSIKMGMDAMVEDFRDPLTGKLNFMNSGDRGQVARNMDIIRRSYLAEIDKINPTFKAARAAWGGPAQAKGLIAQGRVIGRTHPEDVKKIIDRLSPAEREFYKMGAADWLRDEVAKAGPKAAPVRGLSKYDYNDMMKDRIRPLFDSQKKFDDFIDAVTDERTIFVQAGKRLGGSQTAERGIEDNEAGLSAAVHGAHAVGHAATKNYIGAVKALIRARQDLGLLSDKRVNEAMAHLMFDPTIDLNGPEGINLLRRIPSAKARPYLERFRRTGTVIAAGSADQQRNARE